MTLSVFYVFDIIFHKLLFGIFGFSKIYVHFVPLVCTPEFCSSLIWWGVISSGNLGADFLTCGVAFSAFFFFLGGTFRENRVGCSCTHSSFFS